jgi:DNA-binding YbaB/EbfC family protein
MSDDKNPFGGMDMGALFGQVMNQAQQMKGRMESMQDKVKDIEVEGQAGGGIIQVTATGDGRIRRIRIDPVAVDRRDVEMLEDLLVAGVNDAIRRANEVVKSEMGDVTGGMDMGGLGALLGNLGK